MIKRIVFIFVTVVVLVSCASAPKQWSAKERLFLLNEELERWQSFKFTGLADIQHQTLAIRRTSVIALSEGKFRFDILDSGFLGMGSGVFMSIYVDENGLQLRKPGSTKVESIKTDKETEMLLKFLTQKWSDLLADHKNSIVTYQTVDILGLTINFTDKMRLAEITSKEEKLKINFIYDNREILTEINISVPLVKKLIIQIDKIEYNDIVVNPLVKSG